MAAIAVFLIIAAVFMSLVILGGCFLLLIVFGHPDDKNAAYFPKAITLLGLFLAFASVLVLPFDIANKSSSADGSDGGISVDLLWEIVYILLAILIVAIIPFAYFYYESDVDPEDLGEDSSFFDTQAGQALKFTIITLIIFIVLIAIMYTQLGTAYVPVVRLTRGSAAVLNLLKTSIGDLTKSSEPTTALLCRITSSGAGGYPATNCSRDQFHWVIPVSLPLYIIALLAFIGWWFFTFFVGVGFMALPMDLINEYRTRPTPISTKVYFEQRALLGKRCKDLIALGEAMRSGQEAQSAKPGYFTRNRNTNDLRAFEKNYFYLKKDYQILYVAHKLKGGNPLVYIGKLILGLISIVISATWLIHICIFVLPASAYKTNFLNTFFIDLTNDIPGFALFGVCAFAIYSFYLLWCVVKGNFKLGVRFLFWKLYPMEIGNTLMNAFLLNTWFILLCSLPTVQFCIIAFPYYAAQSQANVMFGVLVNYLEFFDLFFNNNVFVIILVCVSGLSLLVFLVFPNNKSQSIEAQLDKLAKSKNTSLHDYADE